MTHPLLVLQRLLNGRPAPTSGTVQSVNGTLARVRTSVGINLYPTNGVAVSPGATVTLGPAGITGVTPSRGDSPVYDL